MFIKYDYTADGKLIMVEVTEEVAQFLREDKRVTGNADRRERDHCEFHIDAMDYEGEAFAYQKRSFCARSVTWLCGKPWRFCPIRSFAD